MKVLTYGEIMDGGASVFHSVATLDGSTLLLRFEGVIRIDNPYRALEGHLADLGTRLLELKDVIDKVVIDFADLRFCNSNGFYIIMDMVEAVYQSVSAPVTIRRIQDDDWQQETLPILLNLDEEHISARTQFVDVREL